MKKFLLVVSSAVLLMSCGGKKSDSKTGDSKKSDVSAPMQGFMDKLDGQAAHTGDALKQYSKEGVATADMEMYDLKNPEIMSSNGNCYLLRCKSGLTLRSYNICWEGDKIASIEDKGME